MIKNEKNMRYYANKYTDKYSALVYGTLIGGMILPASVMIIDVAFKNQMVADVCLYISLLSSFQFFLGLICNTNGMLVNYLVNRKLNKTEQNKKRINNN